MWFWEQVAAGVSLDDQRTLWRAAKNMGRYDLSFQLRVLNPSLASALASTDPKVSFHPRETRVLKGRSLVVHGEPSEADNLCMIFNKNSSKARQVVQVGSKYYAVLAPEECRKLLKRRSCKYDMLWKGRGESELVPPNRPERRQVKSHSKDS